MAAVIARKNFTVEEISPEHQWNDYDDGGGGGGGGIPDLNIGDFDFSKSNNDTTGDQTLAGKFFNFFQSVSELMESPSEETLSSETTMMVDNPHNHNHHHHSHQRIMATISTTTPSPAATTSFKPTPTRRLFDVNRILFRDPSTSPRPGSNSNIPEIIFFDMNSSSGSSEISSESPVATAISNITSSSTTTTTAASEMFWPTIMNTTTTTTPLITTPSIPPVFILDSTLGPAASSPTPPDWLYFHPQCLHSPEDYELFTSMLCSSLAVLGVVYFLYGYRCFRALSFFISMVLGTTLFYTVCHAEHLPPLISAVPGGNLLPALITGTVVGLLAMLVAYIGLFITGLHLGLMLAVQLLFVIYLLRPYYLVLQAPLSSLTVLIFFVAFALVGALTTVYFSKGCTIIASSMYGSALTLLCADYFLEDFKLAHWFLDHLSQGDQWYGLLDGIKRHRRLCVVSHVMLALWPLLAMFGMMIQSCLTAKNVQYRNGYGMVDTGGTSGSRAHHQPFRESHSMRSHHHHHHGSGGSGSISGGSSVRSASGNQEETRLEQRHRKYRYLYQVRTAHGDVISQHYLQSLQNKGGKQHPNQNHNHHQLCLPDQDSFTFNSDLSSHFFPSESRTTTLSVA